MRISIKVVVPHLIAQRKSQAMTDTGRSDSNAVRIGRKVPQADIRRGLKYSPRTQNRFTRSSHRAGRPEMLAPKKRQAKAWTLVPHFARRTVSSASDASLRLTAQEDDEIRALAGLRAQLLV
jgi:hypothetical protein